MFRTLSIALVVLTLAPAARIGVASDVVELRIRGKYLSAPANVRIIVAVTPDQANRSLRVEMDGDQMFRASTVTLGGKAEKRVHEIEFKNVPQGTYSVQAEVSSGDEIRGTAMTSVNVIGFPE